MEYLKTVGDFEITSEKIGNYKPDWFLAVFVIGFVGICVSFLLFSLLFIGLTVPTELKYGFTILLIISGTMFLATIMTYVNVCGISIELRDTSILHTTNILSTSKFALTNDAEQDAKKIKQVVEKYTELANRLNAAQKEKDAEEKRLKQECCIRYKDVIKKVKTE